ncbi:NosR/NirI family protein [Pusillimonas sp. ANT_WB101]|uniref:NosR/NirI family protein n=1 Tax=Pusillimonas sp. ANT_WB101 TaxID=2597356 RepID=UPI0011EEA2DB|nr:NosR/NirI family protein [Pusillimonas sp. ANT_WB101]KAA0888519.1 regulatory protein NosR [Pusillimonas sp. ANT_WB101]
MPSFPFAVTRHAAHVVFLLLLSLFCILLPAHSAQAQKLPVFLKQMTTPDIFPGADRLGPVEGKPPVARAYAGDKQLGYVYLTTDIVNTRGYSSKPIDTLVAIDNNGKIVGARLVEHHEPIVLIGIPESKVEHFIQGYVGLNFLESPPRPGAPTPVDIVSGATVTLMVIGDSITRSSIAVARAYAKVTDDTASGAATAGPAPIPRIVDPSVTGIKDWSTLLAEGAVANLHLTVADVNKQFADTGRQNAIDHPEPGEPDDQFIDLYTALVSSPSIGRSLLGNVAWERLRDRLKPGQQAILVAGNGPYSFKGSGYVRGGIFDRIEVIQHEHSFRFTDRNHQRLATLAASGAPRLTEIALYVTPDDAVFSAAEPWRLQLMVQRVISVKEKAFVTFDLDYALPAAYSMPDPEAAAAAAQLATATAARATQPGPQSAAAAATGAADDAGYDPEASSTLWKQIWKAKTGQIVVVSIALLILMCVFFFQDQLARRPVFYDRFRLVFLTFSLVWLGWYSQAQLSVVNVLTFFNAVQTDFRWEYFLMDPVVFILWCATAISLIFWNRGAFCGWLCPFGSLQELTNRIAKKLGIKQITVPHGVNTRLSALKYIVFIMLFGVAFYDLALAERLSEVEPFKTAIILKFMRYWPFVLFAVLLLVAGLFIERFFCRYLCPLGAALAIPARLRIFNWLKRYNDCGNPCQRCSNECPVQAINPEGDINPNECIQCLHCQMLYHHNTKCPHLIQKNARRQRNRPAPGSAKLDETVARYTPGRIDAEPGRQPGVRPRVADDAPTN